MPQGKGTYGSQKKADRLKKRKQDQHQNQIEKVQELPRKPMKPRKPSGTATRSVLSQSVTRRYPEKAAKANARAKAGKGKGGRGKPSRGGIKKKKKLK